MLMHAAQELPGLQSLCQSGDGSVSPVDPDRQWILSRQRPHGDLGKRALARRHMNEPILKRSIAHAAAEFQQAGQS